jgi:hypothetical protein
LPYPPPHHGFSQFNHGLKAQTRAYHHFIHHEPVLVTATVPSPPSAPHLPTDVMQLLCHPNSPPFLCCEEKMNRTKRKRRRRPGLDRNER